MKEELKNAKVVCLHCHEENINEEHRCLWEVFDYIVEGVAEIKEWQCKNSGLNWKDYYEYLKREIIKFK